MQSLNTISGRTKPAQRDETVPRRRRFTTAWRRASRRVLLVLIGGGIGLALLMNGSSADPYRQVAFLTLAFPLLLSLFVKVGSPETRNVLSWWMTCAVLAVGWSLVQAAPLPFGWAGHPVWEELAELQIEAGRYISVSPVETISALPSLILPFAVFAAVLILCQQREEALFAWKMLMAIGLSLVALSVVLEVYFPEVLFFSSFPVGIGAFNGIFVNRNVTASFLGLLAFATTAQLMMTGSGNEHRQRGVWSLTEMNWVGARQLALGTTAFLIVVALITTRSRAGVTFGLMMLTLALALFFILGTDRRPRTGRQGFTPRQKAAIALGLGCGVFVIYGESVLSRMSTVNEDARWCVWAATWEAIRERPLVGSGFGTFADVFPRYRGVDCLGARDMVVRTHNAYLEYIAGTGLVGAFVLLVGFAALVRVLAAGIARRRTLRAIPIFTAGSLGFVALHSAFDFPVQIPGISLYFAALLGVGCAVSLLDSAPRRRRSGLSGIQAERH